MLKALILGFALAVAGCATNPLTTPITAGASPEAQIATGADTVAATATLATVALRNHAISVNAAEGYSSMLAAAGKALHSANADLLQCRKDTGSNEKTAPDPCWPKVADVVTIALQNITSVRQALAK